MVGQCWVRMASKAHDAHFPQRRLNLKICALPIFCQEPLKKHKNGPLRLGIPKLYVEFWWPLFLATKFTFLFLYLAKIQIFIPKSAYEGGGVSRFSNYS